MADLLDRERLLALGRLNTTFILLEQMVTNALCDLLQCQDDDIAKLMVEPLSFRARLDKVLQLLKHHAKRHEFEPGVAGNVEAAIADAKDISRERNRLVRARLKIDTKSPFGLADASTGIQLDTAPATMDTLSSKALAASLGLAASMIEFMNGLRALQGAEDEPATNESGIVADR